MASFGSSDSKQTAIMVGLGGLVAFYLGRSMYYQHVYNPKHNQAPKPVPHTSSSETPQRTRIAVINPTQEFTDGLARLAGPLCDHIEFEAREITLFTDQELAVAQRTRKDVLNAYGDLGMPCLLERTTIMIGGSAPDAFATPAEIAAATKGQKMTIRHEIVFTLDGANVKSFKKSWQGVVAVPTRSSAETLALVDIFAPDRDTFLPKVNDITAIELSKHRELLKENRSGVVAAWETAERGDSSSKLLLFHPMGDSIREFTAFLRYGHQEDPPSFSGSLLRIGQREGAAGANNHLRCRFANHVAVDVQGADERDRFVATVKAMGLTAGTPLDGLNGEEQLVVSFHTTGTVIDCIAAEFNFIRLLALLGFRVAQLRLKAPIAGEATGQVFIAETTRGLVPKNSAAAVSGSFAAAQYFEEGVTLRLPGEAALASVQAALGDADGCFLRSVRAEDGSFVCSVVLRLPFVGCEEASNHFDQLLAKSKEVSTAVGGSVVASEEPHQRGFTVFDTDAVAAVGSC